jgi:hypothetical protein
MTVVFRSSTDHARPARLADAQVVQNRRHSRDAAGDGLCTAPDLGGLSTVAASVTSLSMT